MPGIGEGIGARAIVVGWIERTGVAERRDESTRMQVAMVPIADNAAPAQSAAMTRLASVSSP